MGEAGLPEQQHAQHEKLVKLFSLSSGGNELLAPWRPLLSRLLQALVSMLLYSNFDPMTMEPSAEALLALIAADYVRKQPAPQQALALVGPR